ncbi:MAG: hypothetical protein QOE70_5414 [Chthoniobacter sp.]|jgi:hypothetical protein|nr:hypothetical protein [Chthoniobacter sp.]
MMTLESRLATVVSLLPSAEKPRFAAPLALDESADSRLVEAVRALAKVEGLVCMTPGEFARAAAQHAAERVMPATELPTTDAPADDESPEALAARFAAITDPRAQTAFWRSLTAEQRAAILKVQ